MVKKLKRRKTWDEGQQWIFGHILVQRVGRPVTTLKLLAGAAWAEVISARISRLAQLVQSVLVRGPILSAAPSRSGAVEVDYLKTIPAAPQ
jgi:hypothetical protein